MENKKKKPSNPLILNMTFEEAIKKALSTPIKNSKVNKDKTKTKKAKKKPN